VLANIANLTSFVAFNGKRQGRRWLEVKWPPIIWWHTNDRHTRQKLATVVWTESQWLSQLQQWKELRICLCSETQQRLKTRIPLLTNNRVKFPQLSRSIKVMKEPFSVGPAPRTNQGFRLEWKSFVCYHTPSVHTEFFSWALLYNHI